MIKCWFLIKVLQGEIKHTVIYCVKLNNERCVSGVFSSTYIGSVCVYVCIHTVLGVFENIFVWCLIWILLHNTG